jgi:nucleoside 2-deoxyribosyltransferase
MSASELIYLASPYNHTDARVREARYRAAMHCVAESMMDVREWNGRKVVVYSPIVHNHPTSLLYTFPREWEFWRALDFPMLERCDRLVVLKLEGWDRSVGVTAELSFARDLGKPILCIEQWAEFGLHMEVR